VEYLYKNHKTPHIYSLDFLQNVLDVFVRTILTTVEERSLERDYPEYLLQLNELYDGTLVFELSNNRVWRHDVEDQERLEAEWVKELNEKYPVTINWKVVNKIKKLK